MRQGIIVPHLEFDTFGYGLTSEKLLLPKLKQALLYWESVATPIATSKMNDGYIPVVQDLGKSGIVEVSDLDIFPSGPVPEKARLERVFEHFLELRNRPGQSWAFLVQDSTHSFLPLAAQTQSAPPASKQLAISIALTSKLPIPDPKTSFEDIIEFRERNIDKLREMQFEINRTSSLYSNLSDEEEPLILAHKELDRALSSYAATIRSRLPIASHRILTFGVTSFVAGLPTIFTDPQVGILASGAIGTMAGIKLSQIDGKLPALPSRGPFSYAFAAKRTL